MLLVDSVSFSLFVQKNEKHNFYSMFSLRTQNTLWATLLINDEKKKR